MSRPMERKEPVVGFTGPPESERGLARVLARNIRSLQRRHEEEEARAGTDQRMARAITDFAGSMLFVYLHLALFGAWIVINLRWVPGVPAWDPTLVVLAMIASVERFFSPRSC